MVKALWVCGRGCAELKWFGRLDRFEKEIRTSSLIVCVICVLIGVFPESVWPALIASGTALAIAFVAYPWQRNRDRQLKLADEKRESYRDFFSRFESFRLAHGTSDNYRSDNSVRESESQLAAATIKLALVASPDCLKMCSDMRKALRRYHFLAEQTTEAINELIKSDTRPPGVSTLSWERTVVARAQQLNKILFEEQETASRILDENRIKALLGAIMDCDIEEIDDGRGSSIAKVFEYF